MSQASQAEVIQSSFAIGGLPAEGPISFAADDQGTRRGTGIGVAGTVREC